MEDLEGRLAPSVTPPLAHPDFADTDGTNPVIVQVLANDTSTVGLNVQSVRVALGPAQGRATVNQSTGAITYTPRAGFSGTDSFSYRVRDTAGTLSNAGRVTVIVQQPTANDDFADTDGVNPVYIHVLDNDTDPDGALTSVTVVRQPRHGQAVANNAGVITYTPFAGYSGTDNFLYRVSDEHGAVSKSAKVTVIVHQPTANDDFGATSTNVPITIDVVGNDTDPDGALDPTTISVLQGPSGGSVAIQPGGSIQYTPNPGFAGTDFFTYQVQDVHGVTSNAARVTVAVRGVTGVNDDLADTDGVNPVSIPVLANDFLPIGGFQSLRISTVPQHGRAVVNRVTGQIIYTPGPGFGGTDTFGYKVIADNGSISNAARVSVVVNQPKANDDFADTDGVNPVTIAVLANDTDPDGALKAASVRVVGGPLKGRATVDRSTGEITYVARAGFLGTDSFTYTVADENGARSKPARVTVIVHAPTANDDFASTAPNTFVVIPVLDNDTDPDGPDQLNASSVRVVRSPRNGTVTVNGDGTIKYTPAAGFVGTDSFTYQVDDDPGAASNLARVTVIVDA